MSDLTPRLELPRPRWLPPLLSFVAGFVDSYTFLALFGLFVANVTGSFITAGAELITHDVGIAGKLVAVLAFILAAALTAGLIDLVRARRRAVLPSLLAFETALLLVFTIAILAGAPIKGAGDWRGVVAGSFGAMAMGAQSVIVRLHMRGVPQTNVMTGNMTQLGIETTELLVAWRRTIRNPDPDNKRDFAAVRSRLATVLAIAVGFLLGAATGALSYASVGLTGAPLAVVIVGALTLWALLRDPRH
jgi:uncharacterized membrane protein YoaK (UPF0700 family)